MEKADEKATVSNELYELISSSPIDLRGKYASKLNKEHLAKIVRLFLRLFSVQSIVRSEKK